MLLFTDISFFHSDALALLKHVEEIDTNILADSSKLLDTEIAIADISCSLAEYETAKQYYSSALERLRTETEQPYAL